MTIRLIVSDVDGTLLGPDHLLSSSVKKTVKSYIQNGGMFTLATGRPWQTTRTLANELGIQLPLILCNGAVISKGSEILLRKEIPLSPLVPMLMEANLKGLGVLLFFRGKIGVVRRTKEIEEYERKENVSCVKIGLSEAAEEHVEKVILIGQMTVSQHIWEIWRPHMNGNIAALQSEDNYLELVRADVNKGMALAYMMNKLGLHPSEVMAIGNQLNDLSMFDNAKFGIAVGNSHPLLKRAAHYVCQNSYGEGVVEAMLEAGKKLA